MRLKIIFLKKPYPLSVDPKFIWFHVMHSSCEVIWYKLSLLWKYLKLELQLYDPIQIICVIEKQLFYFIFETLQKQI